MRTLSRSLPDCASGLEFFRSTIAEASIWSSLRIDPVRERDGLRSSDLRLGDFESNRWATVDAVLAARRDRTRGAVGLPTPTAGRLMLYYPDQNLFDGAAEHETNGFFDTDNRPPWDLWVGLFEDDADDVSLQCYLVAWIPEDFVRLASRGIEMNPEQCIQWLDQSDTALARLLT